VRYLVVLNNRSPIGGVYASGNNDGFVRDGEEKHPVLDCLEVAKEQPFYLFARRDMSKNGGSHQSIYIPHSSVVAIHCYADEGPKPMGFIPERN
jgi:hypothetical protein